MKKSFLLAALAIMLLTVGCKSNDPLDPNTYVGKYYVTSNGSVEYATDGDATKSIPLLLYDTINIALDPSNSNGLICSGKIFSGNVTVTDKGIKFNDITYSKEAEGVGYSYSLTLNLVNDYATKDAVGLLKWKSTITGTASGETIGIGVEKSVTGSITNIGFKKI